MIIGHGMVAFRDPNGIRPLVLGKRDIDENRTEYMVASESVALDTLGFEFLRDVAPCEAIYITEEGQLFTRQCADNPVSNPCLFEYVYFARPDSFIDKISVYSAREYGHEAGRENCPRMGRSGYRRGDPDPGNFLRYRAGNCAYSGQTVPPWLR